MSPLSVGSVAIQSTSASAAAVRVRLQLPFPVGESGSPAQAEPLDLRWLTTAVKTAPSALARKVWASDGRLSVSMKRGSSAEVRVAKSPTGVTRAGW